MVRERRQQRSDFHDRHHAAVLMREDVAVDDEVAGIVDKAAAHLEVAGDDDCLFVFGYAVDARWDRENVPPDLVLRRRHDRGIAGLPGRRVVGIEVGLPGLKRAGRGDVFWNRVREGTASALYGAERERQGGRGFD